MDKELLKFNKAGQWELLEKARPQHEHPNENVNEAKDNKKIEAKKKLKGKDTWKEGEPKAGEIMEYKGEPKVPVTKNMNASYSDTPNVAMAEKGEQVVKFNPGGQWYVGKDKGGAASTKRMTKAGKEMQTDNASGALVTEGPTG